MVWTYSGVRPLYDDGASEAKAATRDYVLELDAPGGAPLLSIFGGKITTYRRLAEEALERLAPLSPQRKARAAGPAIAAAGRRLCRRRAAGADAELQRSYPFLAPEHARRLARAYGTRAAHVARRRQSLADLGRDFGATLTEAEVRYLMTHEWARTAEDVLWRRSKLGLRLSADEIAALDDWITDASASQQSPLLEAGGRS